MRSATNHRPHQSARSGHYAFSGHSWKRGNSSGAGKHKRSAWPQYGFKKNKYGPKVPLATRLIWDSIRQGPADASVMNARPGKPSPTGTGGSTSTPNPKPPTDPWHGIKK
jgi:hypothetical protein